MRTVLFLYMFLFVAYFDLHAQYPLLSPFALSLGAAPAFIGLMMGVYALAHIPGNVLAGWAVDRFGGRLFIGWSLTIAGLILLTQAFISQPWQLLLLRAFSGFVLAFLSPACQALLARSSKDVVQQGKLLAGSGIVHMIAAVFSPALGAMLVADLGFPATFATLGALLLVTGLIATVTLPSTVPGTLTDTKYAGHTRNDTNMEAGEGSEAGECFDAEAYVYADPQPRRLLHILAVPFALAFSQGILNFELSLAADARAASTMYHTSLLFAYVSIGALITLSMLFLNRLPADARTMWAAVTLALLFYALATHQPLSLALTLVFIGMAKGVLYPAIAALISAVTPAARYGQAFAWLSVSYSLGAFFGPILAGHVRTEVSPYFLAFLVLLSSSLVLGTRRDARCTSATIHR